VIRPPVIASVEVGDRQRNVEVVKLSTHGDYPLRWTLRVCSDVADASVEVWSSATLQWNELWKLTGEVMAVSSLSTDPVAKATEWSIVFAALAGWATEVLEQRR